MMPVRRWMRTLVPAASTTKTPRTIIPGSPNWMLDDPFGARFECGIARLLRTAE
jgi:hypothetical protein